MPESAGWEELAEQVEAILDIEAGLADSTVQMIWHPREWREDSPWLRMFRNARVWVG